MLVVHPPFVPCRDRLTFLCLAKESQQRKARPRWRLPLGFLSRGGKEGKLASLRQARSLYPPRNKNPRRHLGQERQRPKRWFACSGGVSVVAVCCFASLAISTWSYCFALRLGAYPLQRLCFDGVAVPCPRWRLEFLLQRGKRKGNCLSAASFSLPLSAT